MGRISLTQDQVHVVIKVSQERRREIDNFIDVLGQRVNAEETYAKSVEEMAKAADRIRQGEERYRWGNVVFRRWGSRALSSIV